MRTRRTESPRKIGGTLPDAVRLAVVAGATLFAITACATPGRPAGDETVTEPVEMLQCSGTAVPARALEEPRSAAELGVEAAPALGGHEVPDLDPLEWLIVEESDERVVLMRKLPIPDDLGGGDIREYELIAISTELPPMGPGQSEWMLVSWGSCALSRDLGELGFAGIVLDPLSPPDPEKDRVALLVTEFECNSGQDASGRVELVELIETESTVELVIGVSPSGAQQASCQSNPATPFTVDLERPVGDRVVLNAAVVPARPITASEE